MDRLCVQKKLHRRALLCHYLYSRHWEKPFEAILSKKKNRTKIQGNKFDNLIL